MKQLIKRPDEFYVGLREQGPGNLPLAFLTPYDTTKAFEKRKATVDLWAGGNRYYGRSGSITLPSRNVANTPLYGFRISESIKRTGGWNGGNVVWRIEDPRGFEWEISSSNMAQIIIQSGISAGGIINQRCIIGRIGSSNILIPEGTDLWNQMESDIELHNSRSKSSTITNLSVGDYLTFSNGTNGVYLGKHRLRLNVPSDMQLYDNCSSASIYRHRGGTYCEANSIHEYHLVGKIMGDYNKANSVVWVSAYKTNPQVIMVDPQKFSTTAHSDYFKAKDCYISFISKNPEPAEHIIGLA